MANQGSTRMTTAQLRSMIAGGATRSQLPTKASGGSVSSTRDSAQIAYLNAINRARETAEFRAAQTQTARTISKAKTAQMISVSENTKVMPSYDAQSQQTNATQYDYRPKPIINYSDPSLYVFHGSNPVTNNNVNPPSLFTPQPVNSNGNSQNSSVSGGINVNANYNYATQMNDFQNQHHNSQVNHGQAPQSYYTAGKSSIPFENEVKTSLLGGDIQHQESEINTNVGYLPEINDPQDTIGSATGYAGAGIALAGIGALLLMGRKK